MTLALKFGASVLGAPTKLRVQRAGESPYTTENWYVDLQLDAATPAALEALTQPIRDAQGTRGDLAIISGSDDVRALSVADCREGPTLASVTLQQGAPGVAHNQTRLTLVFEATLQDAASAIQSHESTLLERTHAGAPTRLHHSGKAILRDGEDPADHQSAVLPMLATGYRRVKQTVTRDANSPALIYEVEDEQVFNALPGGVEDGHYVVTDALDADGRSVRTINGFFTGVSAKARALELRPSDTSLLSARVSENAFARRVDFEFRQALFDTDAVARAESLTFTTTRRVVDHALLDTSRPAYRQQIGGAQTEVIQEGSAVGDGRHAAPPPVRFAADLIERRVHYSVPHPGMSADRRWVTTWRYVSRTRFAAPEITP